MFQQIFALLVSFLGLSIVIFLFLTFYIHFFDFAYIFVNPIENIFTYFHTTLFASYNTVDCNTKCFSRNSTTFFNIFSLFGGL